MIPLRDHDRRGQGIPVVTIVFIAINVLVFLYQITLSQEALQQFFQTWAVVPQDITQTPSGQDFLTLFTSQFMHGGFAHIGGNMLYLWIFGDNIEGRLGAPFFILFYLTAGLAAAVAQIAIAPASTVPTLGASGAIAGVLGAYLVAFPGAKVDVIIPRGGMTTVSAIWVLGFWFILQLVQGVASLGADTSGGGVAYFAHVGGFVFGAAIMFLISQVTGGSRRQMTA